MNSKQFFDAVCELRRLQKEYFRTRSHITLREAKEKERIIDNEIARVTKVLNENKQPSMFK